MADKCIACKALHKSKKDGKAGFDLNKTAHKSMCNNHKREYRDRLPKPGHACYIMYQRRTP